MTTPYANLDEKAFWRPSVANKHFFDITELWDPKFHVRPEQKVVTYGSCFAQHIGRALSARGYHWYRTEPPPRGLSDTNKKRFGYDVFSARTGNIYTSTLLLQWVKWALGKGPTPEEVWHKEGRFYDPMRPNVEPNGFATEEELRVSFKVTVDSFRRSIVQADYFVFTLGLTEKWHNSDSGFEYPMCPGSIAGTFDSACHQFENLDFEKARSSLTQAIALIREFNPAVRIILTVSPIPLTATMSGNHVLVATMQSKSILRAVAATVVAESDHVDYFPSYEVINSPAFKGAFFEPNQRSVNPIGVSHVMRQFFEGLTQKFGTVDWPAANTEKPFSTVNDTFENVCEEEFLDAFGRRTNA